MGAESSALAVQEQGKVLGAIKRLGRAGEVVRFGDWVTKVNRKCKSQRRALVITNAALYYFDGAFECKRRIAVSDIRLVTTATASDEFVLHVPSEYDCRLASSKREAIVKLLVALYAREAARAARAAGPASRAGALPALRVQRPQLKEVVATKTATRRNRMASALNISKLLQASIGDTNYDALHVGQRRRMLDLMQNFSAQESVKFSDHVTKVNRRGKSQRRVVVLTTEAMYNLTPSLEMKRRVPIQLIHHVTVRAASQDEFIVHVLSEYDYVFRYADRALFIRCLQAIRNDIVPKPIAVTASSDESFHKLVLTQPEASDRAHIQSHLLELGKRASRVAAATDIAPGPARNNGAHASAPKSSAPKPPAGLRRGGPLDRKSVTSGSERSLRSGAELTSGGNSSLTSANSIVPTLATSFSSASTHRGPSHAPAAAAQDDVKSVPESPRHGSRSQKGRFAPMDNIKTQAPSKRRVAIRVQR